VTDSPEKLLALLRSGDPAAVEETFRRFEPFLRQVVRRHLPTGLRTRFDSEDVVQSVWRSFLQGFQQSGRRFADVDHLRAFLIHATRNRLIDRVRQHGPAVEREQRLTDACQTELPAREPRPSHHMREAELWQRVLALCPAEHRELIRLKRDGYSLEEIAQRCGLHRDSVRRVLRGLARRLAFEPALAPDTVDRPASVSSAD
jgi:RNA polymerase sigma-70 factor (ECF subfamily)